MWGAARENGVLCLKDAALGAASVLEGLLANIALCPATPQIRRLFTAGTWSSVQTSHAQRNVGTCKMRMTPILTPFSHMKLKEQTFGKTLSIMHVT